MRIVFMGTPQFAIPSLVLLARSGYRIVAVVTQEDTRRGRKLVLSPSPVKQCALNLGLKVMQPLSASDPAFLKEMRDVAPDLIVVVAYGQFLPKELIAIPRLGAINLHPSLLPKYRGAAPIQHAILNDESETGVTVLYVGEEMDAGDIIKQGKVRICSTDTSASLGEKCATKGARLLLGAVRDMEKGKVSRKVQDGAKATGAPKIRKTNGLIEWTLRAEQIALRVRAFCPWPGAYTYMKWSGKRILLKILEASAGPDRGGVPGSIVACGHRGIWVGTGKGSLIIRMVQPEGRKPMTAAAFAAGHRELEGTTLG
jgi:methionyl-tRNA formyltransferase